MWKNINTLHEEASLEGKNFIILMGLCPGITRKGGVNQCRWVALFFKEVIYECVREFVFCPFVLHSVLLPGSQVQE